MDRLLASCPFEFKADTEESGVFEGYGSVFGNVDSYGDVIKAGAFKATLRDWKARKRTPPMLLQHGGSMFGGSVTDDVPIGVWSEMREDDHGLFVKGRLIALDSERGKLVHAAMRERALDGLSIGFRAKKFTLGTKPEEPERLLEQIDLVELSVVTMPANDAARIEAVKVALDMTERDFERFLREGGFSRDAAKTIVAHGWRALQRDAELAPDAPLRDADLAASADIPRDVALALIRRFAA